MYAGTMHIRPSDWYREFIMHYFALAAAKIYNLSIRIPRWLFVLLSGAAGSVLLRLMHTPAAPRPPARAIKEPPEMTASAAPTPGSSSTAPATSDGTKKRKRR